MSSNLTIFSSPKVFKGEFSSLQDAAYTSWANLQPKPDIHIFSEQGSTSAVSHHFGFTHHSSIKTSSSGIPLIFNIFSQAEKYANSNIIMYTNADMVYSDDLIKTISKVSKKFSKFLIVGRRLDLSSHKIYHYTNSTYPLKKLKLHQLGKLHSPYGIDYFIFPRNLWNQLPDFMIARQYWDTWLLGEALKLNIPLIDATRSITALHPHHTYNNMKGGLKNASFLKEVEINCKLANGQKASTEDATHLIWHNIIIPIPRIYKSIRTLLRSLAKLAKDTYTHRIKTGNYFRPWDH